MSKTTEQLAGEFLAEIEGAIDKHANAYSKDARWHQFIVILSGGLRTVISRRRRRR
jgi:hypothetical protein